MPGLRKHGSGESALTLRWWSEARGWSAGGGRAAMSRRARSPTAECQTKLGLAREAGQFSSAAPKSCPGSRLWRSSCPCAASRATAVSWATCGASRPYGPRFRSGEASRPAAAFPPGCARWIVTGLGSFHASKRSESDRGGGCRLGSATAADSGSEVQRSESCRVPARAPAEPCRRLRAGSGLGGANRTGHQPVPDLALASAR